MSDKDKPTEADPQRGIESAPSPIKPKEIVPIPPKKEPKPKK